MNATGDEPLDPAAARIIARVRRLMLASSLLTLVGVAAILGFIGYRVFTGEGSSAPVEVTAVLPKDARVIATAVADERILITIEVGGAVEIRSFDARTLKPRGTLRLAPGR